MMAAPESIARARMVGHGVAYLLALIACCYVGP